MRKEICLCAVCNEMLYEGDDLADHIKYEFDGEVDYIELAHVRCAKSDEIVWEGYWTWDEPAKSS